MKNNSLMSKFGVDENTDGFERMDMLLSICGNDAECLRAHERVCTALTDNYAYQIMRAQSLSKQQKQTLLTKLLGESGNRYYKRQERQVVKEKLVLILKKIRVYNNRMISKWRRIKNQRVIKAAKKMVLSEKFTLISQNCIGGVFYHDMGLPFQSPTINLYFKAADFIKFVLNLEDYLA